MLLTLLESTATTAKQPSGLFWVIYIVILVGFMWLLLILSTEEAEEADGISAQGNGTG